MSCPNCSITPHSLSFKLNEEVKLIIVDHFTRHHYTYHIEDTIIHTSEEAGQDLVDFLTAMNMTADAYFKIRQLDWMPINQFDQFQEASWVDHILREKYIRMHYQPIITATGWIYGYEMLARFVDDKGDMIYPNVLFPAAKVRGRTFALDRLCRMSAVRQVKHLKDHQKAFINFIPTAIYRPEYCLRTTVAIANKLSIDSSRFVFEVVETEKVEDTDHLKSILNYYQNNGFHYALDDVGTGYNTLDLLSDLKPPYVKLDMAFVQGVSSSIEKQEVALAFLNKAKRYGAKALAEGVELISDFEWLKSQGYDLFQGYLFGRPAPEPLETEAVLI